MKKIFIILLIACALVGCKGRTYVFSLDTFPPGSEPYKNNWTHRFKTVMYWEHKGGFSQEGKKEINIYIEDNEKNILFKDRFEIITFAVDREVKWDDFEKISCKLFSYQTEGIRETFEIKNKTCIAELEFEYNHQTRKFEKKKFEILK